MSYRPEKKKYMNMEFVLNPRPIDFCTLNLGMGESGPFISHGNKSIILGLILKIENACSKIRLNLDGGI